MERKELVITEECMIDIPKAGLIISFDGQKAEIIMKTSADLLVDGDFRIGASGNISIGATGDVEIVTEGNQYYSLLDEKNGKLCLGRASDAEKIKKETAQRRELAMDVRKELE